MRTPGGESFRGFSYWHNQRSPTIQIFIDMDGVLADFDAHYKKCFTAPADWSASWDKDSTDWERIRVEQPTFYADLPEMHDMQALWRYVEAYQPIVLTGVPSSIPDVATQKRAWIAQHLGPTVPVVCCKSRHKSLYAYYGDIIVDDWEKYRSLWEAKGGIWITHTSAAASIAALKLKGI